MSMTKEQAKEYLTELRDIVNGPNLMFSVKERTEALSLAIAALSAPQPSDAELIAWVWRCGATATEEFEFFEESDKSPHQLAFFVGKGFRTIPTPGLDNLELTQDARAILLPVYTAWRDAQKGQGT